MTAFGLNNSLFLLFLHKCDMFNAFDKHVISPKIQPKNSSCDTSSSPGTDLRPKEQDVNSYPEHLMEANSRRSTMCSIVLLHIPVDLSQQEDVTMMKCAPVQSFLFMRCQSC